VSERDAFALAVRAALAAIGPGGLRAHFTAPLVTAIVADTADGARLAPALAEVVTALERVGVPRGRQFVLLGSASPVSRSQSSERVAELAGALSLPVIAHRPDGPAYTAGRTPHGVAIELDDELREAEAVLCVGAGHAAPGRMRGGPYLLAPGVAASAFRDVLEHERARDGERAAIALALAAEAAVPVDLAVCWDDRGNVVAGRGRECFAALAAAAGFA
jgi:hypothetical protein